jgi:filamentous hemagglutinin family protein
LLRDKTDINSFPVPAIAMNTRPISLLDFLHKPSSKENLPFHLCLFVCKCSHQFPTKHSACLQTTCNYTQGKKNDLKSLLLRKTWTRFSPILKTCWGGYPGLKTRLSVTNLILSTCSLWQLTSAPLNAQIIPDRTLPINSVVTPNGSTLLIRGGTTVGNNLFHSFSDFSVPTQTEAFFNNASTINNIITRVTGSQISNIDGIIRTNGTANLFLLNPNGIIFGSGAQLNIGGSFIGSTANSLKFADGSEFSAINPQAPPLLTINLPIGLQLGANPAPIINRSIANSLRTGNPSAGLETPGKTLALVGGDLLLEGGNLTANQGQITLISTGNPDLISLTPNANGLIFGAQNIQNGNIKLSGGAAVNTSGFGGGSIQIQAGKVTLSEASKLLAETFGGVNGGGIDILANQFNLQGGAVVSTSSFGAGAGGNLTLRADTVELTGTTPLLTSQQLITGTFNPLNLSNGLFSLTAGSGKGGDLIINANRLLVQNGANLFTSTFVNGVAGNLTVKVADTAAITNGSLLFSGTAGTGNGGDLNLVAQQLKILDGSAVSTTPGGTSAGRGGNLFVTANSIELRGTPAGAVIPGGLFTTTLGASDAGNLKINTGKLIVADGAQISASSAGSGRGGNLTITADTIDLSGKSPDGRFLGGLFTSSSLLTVLGRQGTAPAGNLSVTTRRLSVRDGAQISAATGSDGAAGKLEVNASESVEVKGFATGVDPTVQRVAFGGIIDGSVPSAIEANTRGAGKAGDLTIQTPMLRVSNGAEIGVRATSTGAAGNLKLIADTIELNNQGTISAVKVSGTGGNIELNARKVQLNNSIINASVLGEGVGGNITINASDSVQLINGANLSVSSFGPGNAGDIQINTNSLNLDRGNMTATSLLGEGGDINLNVKNDLVLRNNSTISTRAGTENTGGGNGGNIKIKTGVVALLQNSNINANAFDGNGGNIQINTQGLFIAPNSAITASSRRGIDGLVRIISPDINPSSAIVELPINITDSRKQITTGCAADLGNKFVITGQGGLPANPTQPLENQSAWQDWRFLNNVNTRIATSPPENLSAIRGRKTPLVEATNWQINRSGEVELVAENPNIQNNWYPSTGCN